MSNPLNPPLAEDVAEALEDAVDAIGRMVAAHGEDCPCDMCARAEAHVEVIRYCVLDCYQNNLVHYQRRRQRDLRRAQERGETPSQAEVAAAAEPDEDAASWLELRAINEGIQDRKRREREAAARPAKGNPFIRE